MKSLARSAAACAVVASLLVAGTAHAAAPELPWEAKALVAAYQRDYPGLSEGQAWLAYTGQDERVRLLEKLQAQQPSGFGGSWYDPHTNTQHINSIGEAAAQEARTLGGDLGLNIVTHQVKYTVKELKAQAAQANAKVDVINNRVVPDADKDQIKILPQACTDRFNCGKPLRSGVVLWDNYRGIYICSLGFTARATDGSRWAITAGHCVQFIGEGVTWYHGEQPIGPIKYGVFGGNLDAARIHVRGSYWSTGGYMFDPAAPNTPQTVNYSIEYRESIQIGDGVCLSSWHSTISDACGTIVDPFGPLGMPQVTFNACVGDSGGGWYYVTSDGQRWAYGIHSAQVGPDPEPNCHNHARYDSIFTAMPDLDAFWDATTSARLRVEVR